MTLKVKKRSIILVTGKPRSGMTLSQLWYFILEYLKEGKVDDTG